MNKKVSEVVKVDLGMQPQTMAGGAFVAGPAFSMRGYRKALFVFQLGSALMRLDDLFDIGVVDNSAAPPAATTALATAAGAGDDNVMGFLQITGGQGATFLGVDFTNTPADDAITLNDTVFAYDATPDTDAREWADVATFVTAVNTADIGITAAVNGTVAELRATDPGERTITLEHGVTLLRDQDVLTYEAAAYIEVDAAEMNTGATTLRPIIDNVGARASVVSVAVVRGAGRYTPVQAVAVSA